MLLRSVLPIFKSNSFTTLSLKESLLNRLSNEGQMSIINDDNPRGKLTARERLSLLFDEGHNFSELDQLAKPNTLPSIIKGVKETLPITGDGVITGIGSVYGHPVYAYAQEFTVHGGSLGLVHARKICKLMDKAIQARAPIIAICDSGGARIGEGVDALAGYAEIFYRNVRYSGLVPQISLIMGPCAGGAVYSPALSDLILMTEHAAYMFVTGPDIVQAVTGEKITPGELGGHEVHAEKSGVVHLTASGDLQLIRLTRELLCLLIKRKINEKKFTERRNHSLRELLEHLVPWEGNKAYDVKAVIESLVDDPGEIIEIAPKHAPNIVCALTRMGGYTVGIVANQPLYSSGVLDIDASVKAARWVRFLDSQAIPIITLVDVPGFMPGTDQESRGIIRHGAKLIWAYAEARSSPRLTVILRKAYGGAYCVMNSSHLGAHANYAWPQARIAVMGASGAAKIISPRMKEDNQHITSHEIGRIERDYEEAYENPLQAAQRGYIDQVINPTDTRSILIRDLQRLCQESVVDHNTPLTLLAPDRFSQSLVNHGNCPL